MGFAALPPGRTGRSLDSGEEQDPTFVCSGCARGALRYAAMVCLSHEDLVRFVEGVVCSNETEQAQEHLAQCGACRSSWAALVPTSLAHPCSLGPAGSDPTVPDPSLWSGTVLPVPRSGASAVVSPGPAGHAADSLLGRSVGNFVIVRRLGQGGVGAVYLAVHPQIARRGVASASGSG